MRINQKYMYKMEEVKKLRLEIENHYLMSNYPKGINEEIKVKILENIKDKFIVFRNVKDNSEFIFIRCNLNLQENDDIKYVCSKLNWVFKKEKPWIDRFKIEEEEYQELDKIIFRLNAIKEEREIPLDVSNYSFSYKSLSS